MNQEAQILNYMKKGNSITPLEALNKFNCFRLGARIYDLKLKGHEIRSKIIERNGKRFSSYSMVN